MTMSHPPRTERETEIRRDVEQQLLYRSQGVGYALFEPTEVAELLSQLDAVRAANVKLTEALQKIAKREGPYSRDELKFAQNVIDAMSSTAEQALAAMSDSSVAGSVSPEQKGEK